MINFAKLLETRGQAECLFLENLCDFELGMSPGQTGQVNYYDAFLYEAYNKLVGEYNDLCFAIIKKAKIMGKNDFAEKISLLVRPCFKVYKDRGSHPVCDGNSAFIEEDYTPINNAKALLK